MATGRFLPYVQKDGPPVPGTRKGGPPKEMKGLPFISSEHGCLLGHLPETPFLTQQTFQALPDGLLHPTRSHWHFHFQKVTLIIQGSWIWAFHPPGAGPKWIPQLI